MTIAALYVHTGCVYFGLDDVDPWDKARDARLCSHSRGSRLWMELELRAQELSRISMPRIHLTDARGISLWVALLGDGRLRLTWSAP